MNKSRRYKILFLIGLTCEVVGQLILSQGNDFLTSPLDFAHWFLLLGVVLLIPQVISFPDSIFSNIGIPVILIGIVSIIGMCIVDFTLWSFQDDLEARNQFIDHIRQVPSIWKPFVKIGPYFLNTGLFLLCLNYLKENRIGVAVVSLATIFIFIPVAYKYLFIYLLTLIGYAIIFNQKEVEN